MFLNMLVFGRFHRCFILYFSQFSGTNRAVCCLPTFLASSVQCRNIGLGIGREPVRWDKRPSIYSSRCQPQHMITDSPRWCLTLFSPCRPAKPSFPLPFATFLLGSEESFFLSSLVGTLLAAVLQLLHQGDGSHHTI